MHLDFGDTRITTDDPMTIDTWTYATFGSDCTSGSCVLTIDFDQTDTVDGTATTTVERNLYYGNGAVDVNIGSYKHVSHYFHGYMALAAFSYSSTSWNTFAHGSATWGNGGGNYWTLTITATTLVENLGSCAFGSYDDGSDGCTACDTSCTEGCVDTNACTVCHPSCGSCADGETGIDECTSCKCGAVLVDADSGKSACQCKPGYLGTADGCKPNCADYGCKTCTSLLEHSCEVCDDDHMMSPDGDGTCTFCRDTPEFIFSRTCTPRDHHWPNSHCTCRTGQFWDSNYKTCRQTDVNAVNDCLDSSA